MENQGRHQPGSSWGQRRNSGPGLSPLERMALCSAYYVYSSDKNFRTKPSLADRSGLSAWIIPLFEKE